MEDTISIAGYLAYSFAAAFRTEPTLSYIRQELGDDYLAIFDLDTPSTGAVAQTPQPQLNAGDWSLLHSVAQVSQEALFAAGIDPRRAASALSPDECERLVSEIKTVLARAIRQGGTTLRDFTRADGRPGYFVQELQVYGRAGAGCVRCGHPLESLRQGQRTTVFCPYCQR